MKDKRKVCYCVYHDLSTEERSREVMNVISTFGETILVSCTKKKEISGISNFFANRARDNYLSFLLLSLFVLLKNGPFNVVFLHDNYTSILIPFIKLFIRPRSIVYDASEYYPLMERQSWVGGNLIVFIKEYILRLFERLTIGFADVVVAANIERAIKMKTYYRLTRLPIVFDNIHKILDDYNSAKCDEKYSSYFNHPVVFTIVYAGGIARERDTYLLAEAVKVLGPEYQLLVIGSATEFERRQFATFINNNGLARNVHYLGFVTRAELKYLYERCDAGFVAFAKTSFNNYYCASGKLFECLFCGRPIICSDNPPLRNICNQYGVGIASDDYSAAISLMKKDYQKYRKNALSFAVSYNYDGRYEDLKRKLHEALYQNK